MYKIYNLKHILISCFSTKQNETERVINGKEKNTHLLGCKMVVAVPGGNMPSWFLFPEFNL